MTDAPIRMGDPDDPGKKMATSVAPPPPPTSSPRPTPVEANEVLEPDQRVRLLVLFKGKNHLRLTLTAEIASSLVREFERQCGKRNTEKHPSPQQPLVLKGLKQSLSFLTMDSSQISAMVIEEAFGGMYGESGVEIITEDQQ